MTSTSRPEGVVRGLKKGYPVKRHELQSKEYKGTDKVIRVNKVKNSFRRPRPAKHAIKAVIHDVVGFLPFERRAQELLKIGREKKAMKYCKKRIGSHQLGKRKRDQLAEGLRQKRK